MPMAPVFFGSSPDIAITAGEDLGGQRAVQQDDDGAARYADAGTPCEVLGITTAAAASGTFASIRTSGAITDPSFDFIPSEPIYLGARGALTQVPPRAENGAAVDVIVGTAITDKTVLIRIRQPVTLA